MKFDRLFNNYLARRHNINKFSSKDGYYLDLYHWNLVLGYSLEDQRKINVKGFDQNIMKGPFFEGHDQMVCFQEKPKISKDFNLKFFLQLCQ